MEKKMTLGCVVQHRYTGCYGTTRHHRGKIAIDVFCDHPNNHDYVEGDWYYLKDLWDVVDLPDHLMLDDQGLLRNKTI